MRLKIVITLLIAVFLNTSADAQFWKKLADRAKESAEEAVIRKTEEKAAEQAAKKTEKALDKVFNPNISFSTPIDPALLPSSYDFSWKYTLTMTHKKGDINMTYFLKKDAKYFASKPKIHGKDALANMTMVYDNNIPAIVILTNHDGQKMGNAMKSDFTLMDDSDTDNPIEDYDFKVIEGKSILGYDCEGYRLENKRYIIKMYVLLDAPISFNHMFSTGKSMKLPKGFDSKWLDKAKDGLMMEMHFKDKKKRKNSMVATCTELEEQDLSIDLSEYDFSFQQAFKN